MKCAQKGCKEGAEKGVTFYDSELYKVAQVTKTINKNYCKKHTNLRTATPTSHITVKGRRFIWGAATP